MIDCNDAKQLLILKLVLILIILFDYWLGKTTKIKVNSGLEFVLAIVGAALTIWIFLIIAAVIKYKEWRTKYARH